MHKNQCTKILNLSNPDLEIMLHRGNLKEHIKDTESKVNRIRKINGISSKPECMTRRDQGKNQTLWDVLYQQLYGFEA